MKRKMYKRVPLTPYGRWVMSRIYERQSSVNELAGPIGVLPENLSRMLHGRQSGITYRPKIERILGEPPEDLRDTA